MVSVTVNFSVGHFLWSKPAEPLVFSHKLEFATVELKKSVCPEIIDDLRIRVKWISEGSRPVEATLQFDPR